MLRRTQTFFSLTTTARVSGIPPPPPRLTQAPALPETCDIEGSEHAAVVEAALSAFRADSPYLPLSPFGRRVLFRCQLLSIIMRRPVSGCSTYRKLHAWVDDNCFPSSNPYTIVESWRADAHFDPQTDWIPPRPRDHRDSQLKATAFNIACAVAWCLIGNLGVGLPSTLPHHVLCRLLPRIPPNAPPDTVAILAFGCALSSPAVAVRPLRLLYEWLVNLDTLHGTPLRAGMSAVGALCAMAMIVVALRLPPSDSVSALFDSFVPADPGNHQNWGYARQLRVEPAEAGRLVGLYGRLEDYLAGRMLGPNVEDSPVARAESFEVATNRWMQLFEDLWLTTPPLSFQYTYARVFVTVLKGREKAFEVVANMSSSCALWAWCAPYAERRHASQRRRVRPEALRGDLSEVLNSSSTLPVCIVRRLFNAVGMWSSGILVETEKTNRSGWGESRSPFLHIAKRFVSKNLRRLDADDLVSFSSSYLARRLRQSLRFEKELLQYTWSIAEQMSPRSLMMYIQLYTSVYRHRVPHATLQHATAKYVSGMFDGEDPLRLLTFLFTLMIVAHAEHFTLQRSFLLRVESHVRACLRLTEVLALSRVPWAASAEKVHWIAVAHSWTALSSATEELLRASHALSHFNTSADCVVLAAFLAVQSDHDIHPSIQRLSSTAVQMYNGIAGASPAVGALVAASVAMGPRRVWPTVISGSIAAEYRIAGLVGCVTTHGKCVLPMTRLDRQFSERAESIGDVDEFCTRSTAVAEGSALVQLNKWICASCSTPGFSIFAPCGCCSSEVDGFVTFDNESAPAAFAESVEVGSPPPGSHRVLGGFYLIEIKHTIAPFIRQHYRSGQFDFPQDLKLQSGETNMRAALAQAAHHFRVTHALLEHARLTTNAPYHTLLSSLGPLRGVIIACHNPLTDALVGTFTVEPRPDVVGVETRRIHPDPLSPSDPVGDCTRVLLQASFLS